MATLYDVPAPAKINLFLHVTGRRGDGYHTVQTAFRFIGLYDYLHFERRCDGRIERDGVGLAGLAPEADLVIRAATALQQASGTSWGVQIAYTKNIPAGGGLGGGSSNAATTLIALNRLWNTGFTRAQLQALGATLGADVPVFIYGQAAFAQGRGDEFQPLQLAPAHYVVVQPPATVSTAEVFAWPCLTRDAEPVTITFFTDWQRVAAGKSVEPLAPYFGRNDLEPAAFALNPVVANTASWLHQQGFSARMSGSGACFFIECIGAENARMIQENILGKMKKTSGCGTASRVVQQAWACPGLQDHPLKYWIRS